MVSMLDDNKLAEGQIESCLSNLLSEAGVSPSAPPTTMKTSRAPRATIHRSAGWRYVVFVGSQWQHPLVALLGGGRPPIIQR
jgi:hypothetical protein